MRVSRLAVALVIAAALVIVLVGWQRASNAPAVPAVAGTADLAPSPVGAAVLGSSGARGASGAGASAVSDAVANARGVPGSADMPGCADGLWAHVYHPNRLLVKQDCVTVTGTLVLDTNHGRWNEIHPVSKIEIR